MPSSLRLIVFPLVILGLALPPAPLRAQEAQPPAATRRQAIRSIRPKRSDSNQTLNPPKKSRKPPKSAVAAKPNSTKSWTPPIKSGSTKTSPTSSPPKSAAPSSACKPTKSASNSSSNSGYAAIQTRIRPKTPLKKSTIAASPMPTSISPRASPAGRPIAAAFTSCGARRRSRYASLRRLLRAPRR